MGDRLSRKRNLLPVLIAAGFALLQTTGRTQDRIGKSGPAQIAKSPVARPDVREDDDPGLRRLGAELKHFRSIGDAASAAKVFARMFPLVAVVDPAAALKIGASARSNRVEGVPGNIKDIGPDDGTSPVFFSPEDEKNPSATIWNSGRGEWALFSAAEQWAGGQPRDIRVRKSSDRGLTWTETIVVGDGRPWTQPSLWQVSGQSIGMAFVKDWAAGDGDIFFARLSEDLTTDAEFPVTLGQADQRSPSLATDYCRYPAPYLYMVYAESEGLTRSVKFVVSPDLGASWTRAATIASFSGPDSPDIKTAIAFDPDRNALHVAFSWPQGQASGIAVASSTTFGASWSDPVFVTPKDDEPDSSPRIAAKRGTVLVVYEHGTSAGGADIGMAGSSDSGRNWASGGRLASAAAAERFPDVRAAEGTGAPRFFASFVEGGTRVHFLSREAAGPGTWITEMALEIGGGPIESGPVVVVPMPAQDDNGSAGVFWAQRNPDYDVRFGSAGLLSLADLTVIPPNQDVPYVAGTTSFTVAKSGAGHVDWTAAVTEGQTWLTIQSGASGSNAGTIVTDYQENTDFTPRTGSIKVTPADGTIPSVTVTVTQAGAPALEVTPADGLASTGPEGGPFEPPGRDYALQNAGGTALDWTATPSRTWIAVSPASGTLDAGASTTVTLSTTTAAEGLAAGIYDGVVSFTNGTNGSGSTTRTVSLTVTAPAGSLAVTPTGDLAAEGVVGGPFTPASQAYTLRNFGATSINWTAAKSAAWTTLSASSGELSPGASTIVTVSINAAADELSAGTYDDTVAFINTTNGTGNTARTVTLTVSAPPGVLSVTPAEGLTSAGPVGGPFSPSSQAYSLHNEGGATIAWAASDSQSWVTTSPASGTLPPGMTVTVTVSINTAADALAAGGYDDPVTFTNTTNGIGNTSRMVTLTISALPGTLTVTPPGNFASSGISGGPFTPSSQTYSLQNTGGTAIAWTASKTQTWTTLSATAGNLAAGATAAVTLSVNAAANALAPGTYEDTVTFTNATNGTGNTSRAVTLNISAAGALSVTPSGGLTSTGRAGGPFSPSSQAYGLHNEGGAAIAWAASATQTWVTVSPASGNLAGGAAVTVTVSIGSGANALAAGTYNDTVTFANTTNGAGSTTRPVLLTISQLPVLEVLPSNRDVPFTGGTTVFDVLNTGGGTINWTAAVLAGGGWLSIASGGSGMGSGPITAAFSTNRTSSSRVGIIRVTAAGAAGSPKDVTVTQAGGSITLSLSGQRLIEKAWIIQREYGRLTVSVGNPAGVPVDTFRIFRKSGSQAYLFRQEVAGSEVGGSSWTTNDAFLESGTSYTYKVVAYDALGDVIIESNEITI